MTTIRAILVGIEEYDKIAPAPPGPCRAVLELAEWLLQQGVLPETIHVFLSPTRSSDAEGNWSNLKSSNTDLVLREPSFDTFNKFWLEDLPRVATSGELLLFFWAGHGSTAAGGDRLCLFKDFSLRLASEGYTLSLTSLCERLNSSDYSRFSKQLLLFDTCAARMRFRPPATVPARDWARRNRYIFCAVEEGDYALSRNGEGVFSRHLMDYLRTGASLTDLAVFSEGFRRSMDLQNERFYECYFRSSTADITTNPAGSPAAARSRSNFRSRWYTPMDMISLQIDCDVGTQLSYNPDPGRKRDGRFTIVISVNAKVLSQPLLFRSAELTYSVDGKDCWAQDTTLSIAGHRILFDGTAKRFTEPYHLSPNTAYRIVISREFQPPDDNMTPARCASGLAALILAIDPQSPESNIIPISLTLQIERKYVARVQVVEPSSEV